EICGGTLQYMDDYTGALKSLFYAPPESMIDYYWLRNPLTSYEFNYCSQNSRGCARQSTVLSKIIPYEHELVHAVRGADSIVAHPLLEEGAAVFWGDDSSEAEIEGSLSEIIDWNHEEIPSSERTKYY